MALEVDLFPAARADRSGPANRISDLPGAPRPTPRMRVFALNYPNSVPIQKVACTPAILGPAVIVDMFFMNAGDTYEFNTGVQLYVSDDNNTGPESQALGTAITGAPILEPLRNQNSANVEIPGVKLGPLDTLITAAGALAIPPMMKLGYFVPQSTFYVKVVFLRSATFVEGYLRVLEGVTAEDFFLGVGRE